MATEKPLDSINHSLEKAQLAKNQSAINSLHRTADLLQSFAAKSKQKLTRGKALERAAILSGYKDYQTAKESVETAGDNELALNKRHVEVVLALDQSRQVGDSTLVPASGMILPWEADRGFVKGQFLIQQGHEYISVKLCRYGEPESALEVVFEMDVDLPRLSIYRPEMCDEPIFSVHADKPGVVLQYMQQDDEMYHKNRADAVGTEMIKKVAHATQNVWFVPSPEDI